MKTTEPEETLWSAVIEATRTNSSEPIKKARQAYADQQVNRVLDEAIDGVRLEKRIYGSAQTYDAIIEILEKLKIKQP